MKGSILQLKKGKILHLYGQGGAATLACMVYSTSEGSSLNGLRIVDPGVIIKVSHIETETITVPYGRWSGGGHSSYWSEGEEDITTVVSTVKEEKHFSRESGKESIPSQIKGGFCALRVAAGNLRVENCELTSTEPAVLIIDGDARPIIEKCHIHNGPGVGIMVYGLGSSPLVRNCMVQSNGSHGVLVNDDQCCPVLVGNEISGNAGWGLCLAKGVTGAKVTFGDNAVTKNAAGDVPQIFTVGSDLKRVLSFGEK